MISINQWGGIATNASPYSLPPGGMVRQVNLQCLSPGQLNCRRGFTLEGVGPGEPVLRSFLFHNNGRADIIYQRGDGTVYKL